MQTPPPTIDFLPMSTLSKTVAFNPMKHCLPTIQLLPTIAPAEMKE